MTAQLRWPSTNQKIASSTRLSLVTWRTSCHKPAARRPCGKEKSTKDCAQRWLWLGSAAVLRWFFPQNPMFTNDLLQGKRILITGGGTGIGRAMAERFLQLGATVFICGRRAEVVQKTAAELSLHRRNHRGLFLRRALSRRCRGAHRAIVGERPARRAGEQCCGKFSGTHGRAVVTRVRRRHRHCAQRHHQHDHGLRPPLAGRQTPRRGAQHRDHLCRHRFGLRCAQRGGQGGRGRADAQPGGGVGRTRQFASSPSLPARFAPKAHSRGCCPRRNWRRSCWSTILCIASARWKRLPTWARFSSAIRPATSTAKWFTWTAARCWRAPAVSASWDAACPTRPGR